MTTVEHIPFHGTDLQVAMHDGRPFAVLKPITEALGIDYSAQVQKLKGKTWAVMGLIPTTGADGKTYQMLGIDRRTLTMWLATIDEGRVAKIVRPILIAYQAEAADALDAHFNGGIDHRHVVEMLSKSDLARLVLESEEEKAILTQALESATPAIAYHERYVANDDAVLVSVWAAQFGLTEPQARKLLVERNLIYRVCIGQRWSGQKRAVVEVFEYRARAGRESFAWFDLRPQHKAPRHHNGQVRQTLYVRQPYALDLGRKLGLAPLTAQRQLERRA